MKRKNLLFYVIFILLSLQFIFYIYIAFTLQTVTGDSFEYLNNARFLIGENTTYSGVRPPLMPILYTPFMLLEKTDFLHGINFLGPKLLAVFFSFGSLIIGYALFRNFFNAIYSITGVFLISLNIIFIHFVVNPLVDIPIMFFIILTFFVYLKAKKLNSNLFYSLTSFLILVTIMVKFTGIFLIPCIILYEILLKNYKQLKSKRFWLMVLTPGFLIYVVLSIGYTIYFGFDINSLVGVLKSIRYQLFVTIQIKEYIDPWYENIIALINSSSLPIFILFLSGFAYSLIRFDKKDRLFIAWFIGFFVGLTFIFKHYESRYIFPFILPYFYFVIRLISTANSRISMMISNKHKRIKNILIILVLVVIFFLPIVNSISEFLSYNDPVYRISFQKEVSEYAASITSKDNTIYWIGACYFLMPEKYIFSIYDEFMYLYCFRYGQVYFYTGRTIKGIDLAEDSKLYKIDGFPYFSNILNGKSSEQIGQTFKEEARPLKDGDTLIIYTGEYMTTATRAETKIEPLHVVRINFNYFGLVNKDSKCRYYKRYGANETITLCLDKGKAYLIPKVRGDIYELYAVGSDGHESIGLFNMYSSLTKFNLTSFAEDILKETKEILIINYYPKKEFYLD